MNTGGRHPRELLEILARDLCGLSGVDWRNRFIDGKASFELDGIRISVDGDAVHVDLDVPIAAARMFGNSAR